MSEEQEKGKCIVVDNGTYMMKAGFNNEEAPSQIFPTIYGDSRWYHRGQRLAVCVTMNCECNKRYVGHEAFNRIDKYWTCAKFPRKYSSLSDDDWYQMEYIWQHALTQFDIYNISPKNIFMTETCFDKKSKREKTTQIIFECFDIDKFMLYPQSLACLHSTRKISGFIVNSGHDLIEYVPIY